MKRYKWTVEFEVDETWVTDGFNLTDEQALEMLAYQLNFAEYHELGAKVTKSPTQKALRKAQGYTS